ncbi:MAG: hypothetical protein KC432_03670 [Thermomicrobiales bacterium]|nr:hypothetical protein [Thermomicrobiales bacterium]
MAAYGDPFSFDQCIACSLAGQPRRCHAPTPLLVAMAEAQRDRKDAGVSATMILDCPRKIALQGQHDWYEHPASYWERFRGTLAHAMLEQYAPPSDAAIVEVRWRKTYTVDGVDIAITGKPDYIDTERGLLLDYKTTQNLGHAPVKHGKPKEMHEEQINIYADLCDGGARLDTGEIEAIQIKVERLRPLAEFYATSTLPPILVDDKGQRSWKCAHKWCALREVCDRA